MSHVQFCNVIVVVCCEKDSSVLLIRPDTTISVDWTLPCQICVNAKLSLEGYWLPDMTVSVDWTLCYQICVNAKLSLAPWYDRLW